jgi:hypothetical protein
MRIFPPKHPTPTKARTFEKNKGRDESRSILTRALTGEDIGFPLARQAARLLRQTQGRKDEEVTLVTSIEPERLDALAWLKLNREGWGIESGLHQRLDVSHNDDRCRIRDSNGIGVIGMFRRLSNSLFIHWRSKQGKLHPEHLTTTDFHSAMSEDHRRFAIRAALSKRPNFKPS